MESKSDRLSRDILDYMRGNGGPVSPIELIDAIAHNTLFDSPRESEVKQSIIILIEKRTLILDKDFNLVITDSQKDEANRQIKLRCEKLQATITEAWAELNQIQQIECSHVHYDKRNWASMDNYCKSDDKYFEDRTCLTCGKKWTIDVTP